MAKTIKCGVCGKHRVPGIGTHACGWVGGGSTLRVTIDYSQKPICGMCREALLNAAMAAALEKLYDLSS